MRVSSRPNANLTMNLKEMTGSMLENFRCIRAVLTVTLAATFLMLVAAAMPSRADAVVAWEPVTMWGPTVLQPGERGGLFVEVGNAGDEMATAWPTVTISLPPGVSFDSYDSVAWVCDDPVNPQTVVCESPAGAIFPPPPHSYTGGVLGLSLPVRISFNIDDAAPVGEHQLTVTASGAGATEDGVFTTDVEIGGPPAPFGVVESSVFAAAREADGSDSTQAGGHPYDFATGFVTSKKFNDPAIPGNTWNELVEPVSANKDVIVDLPPGLVGNPEAVPACTVTLVMAKNCPAPSQVGVAEINNIALPAKQMFAVYNVVPPKSAPAQFAFYTDGGPVVLTPVVRSDGDWGLSVGGKDLTEANPLFATKVVIWGDPADPSHDSLRCFHPSHVGDACSGHPSDGGPPHDFRPELHTPGPSIAGQTAFLSNPTRCNGAPEITTIHLSPWADPAAFQPDGDPDLSDPAWETETASSEALEGCEALSFMPEIDFSPSASEPGAPAGLKFTLTIPQNDDPEGLATAHLRNTTVTLPAGTIVNAGMAKGLASCSSSQIGLVSKSPVRFTKLKPSCPLASKIGTVQIDTPLLDEPLDGDVFIAGQGDHPFDSLAAAYIVVRGPGILGKLAAKVRMEQDTGRITTTVIDNPQVPFETLTLDLKGGDSAPLTLPQTCGDHRVSADFTSWAGHEVRVDDVFTVACPGTANQFDPTFVAGTSDPVAGADSPMRMRVTRDTGKELGRINMDLPRGLLAAPRHVAVCSDAQLATGAAKTGRQLQVVPSCPPASQVGTTTVGVGAGTSPFFPLIPGTAATGRVFLTGTHHASDAPVPAGMRKIAYGAAIEVPAVAGPFDLGRVVVRAAIYANPATADLKVVSDKLPRILTVQSGPTPDAVDGVVLNARDVRVDVDRANFVRNPTSCREQQFGAQIEAQDGTTVSRSSRFQVGDCAALPFRPRLGLRLTGRRQVSTGGHPGVRAVVRQAGLSEAGIAKAIVRLPKSLALDPDNAQSLCEFEAGTRSDLESHCPKGSIVGRARASSPLLKRPLAGNVYFVKNVRRGASGNLIRTLPMIVVALRGEIAVNLRGESSTTRDGKLVNTFAGVPDAPISRFNLNIKGGRNGILTVTRTARANINLCASRQIAEADMNGHNGRRLATNVRVKTPCAATREAAQRRAKRKAGAKEKRRLAAKRRAAGRR